MVGRPAQAHRDPDPLVALRDGRLAHGSPDSLTDLGDILRAGTRQEDEELLAAVADEDVALADHAPAGSRDRPQDAVADDVPVDVVDRLEVVQVEHEDPERPLGADGAGVLLLQPGQAEATVVGVREGVHCGQPLQAVVGQGVVDGEAEVGPELLDERQGVVLESAGRGEDDDAEGDALEDDRGHDDLARGLAEEDGVDDDVGRRHGEVLDAAGPQRAADVVAGREARGLAEPMRRQGLDAVLADQEDCAGVGAALPQEAVQRRVAQPLELELAREHGAEVAHPLLDGVRPGEGPDEAVEGARRGPDLVRRVDREGAGLRVAGAPVVRVDRLSEALLDSAHSLREEAQPAADDEAREREVDRANDQACCDGAREEERREDAIRRQPQEEAEGREDEADHQAEPGHPDREIDEHLRGEARHRVLRGWREGTRLTTMGAGSSPRYYAMVRAGPVRNGRRAIRSRRRSLRAAATARPRPVAPTS